MPLETSGFKPPSVKPSSEPKPQSGIVTLEYTYVGAKVSEVDETPQNNIQCPLENEHNVFLKCRRVARWKCG